MELNPKSSLVAVVDVKETSLVRSKDPSDEKVEGSEVATVIDAGKV